jgi:hypothetical protein
MPRGPPRHQHDYQNPYPRGVPPPVQEQSSSSHTPQNHNGKRAYGAAFDPQDYYNYDPNYQHFMMEQEFYAHAALTPYPPPMDDTYYDEASKLNTETPGDYSSAEGSEN